MLRAVMASRYDQRFYVIRIPKSAGLAMQMHKEAMMDIAWKTDYQIEPDVIESPDPIITEFLAAMPTVKRALALHDQLTRPVILIGTTTMLGEESKIRCTCVMDNYRNMWEPRSVSLEIGLKRYEIIYRRVPGPGIPKYAIQRCSGDENPQPSKI